MNAHETERVIAGTIGELRARVAALEAENAELRWRPVTGEDGEFDEWFAVDVRTVERWERVPDKDDCWEIRPVGEEWRPGTAVAQRDGATGVVGELRARVAALEAQRDEDIRWAVGREQRVAEFVDGLLRILDLGQDDDEYEIDFDVITAAAAALKSEVAGLREKLATAVRYEINWKIRHGDDAPGPCEEPGCDELWAVIVTGGDGVDRRLCAGHAGHTETAEYLVVGFE